MKIWRILNSILFIVGGSVFLYTACATDASQKGSKDDLGLEDGAAAEGAQSAEGDQSAEGAGDDVSAEASPEEGGDVDPSLDEASLTADQPPVPEEAPAPENSEVNLEVKAPEAAPPPPPPSGNRIIRFVIADNTPAFAQSGGAGSPVYSYQKGDPLLVSEQGEWAEVNDHYFVRTSALSATIVPRQNSNEWSMQHFSMSSLR